MFHSKPRQPEMSKVPITLSPPTSLRWQSFIRPLWLLSLGLHLLILRIPVPTQQSAPQPTKSIKVTKLAPVPKAKPNVSPKPHPKIIAANPTPKANPLVTPKPAQNSSTPKATPTPTPSPKSTPTSKPTPTSTPTQTASPGFPGRIEDPIGDVLADLKGVAQEGIEVQDMPNPKLFERDTAIKFNKLVDVPPEDAWNKYLKPLFQNNGFDISLSPKSYGDGKIYILKQSKFVQYLNLVPIDDGQSTVMVVWKVLPN